MAASGPTGAPRRIDGRRLSHQTSFVIRRLAVRRVEAGEKPSRVIASFGLCRTTIYRWMRAKRSGGLAALDRRRHPGRPPRVSSDQAALVREWIVAGPPRDHGIASRMWTRRAVADLVRARLGVAITPMSAGRLLRRIQLDPMAATSLREPHATDGGDALLFAVDRRGAFLCRVLHGPASATRTRKAMDDLAAAAGAKVSFGLGSHA